MTINSLIERGALAIGTSPEILKSRSRLQILSITRHAIAGIAYKNGYKHREIAEALQRSNHATSINSCRRNYELLQFDKYYRDIYNFINTAPAQPPED